VLQLVDEVLVQLFDFGDIVGGYGVDFVFCFLVAVFCDVADCESD